MTRAPFNHSMTAIVFVGEWLVHHSTIQWSLSYLSVNVMTRAQFMLIYAVFVISFLKVKPNLKASRWTISLHAITVKDDCALWRVEDWKDWEMQATMRMNTLSTFYGWISLSQGATPTVVLKYGALSMGPTCSSPRHVKFRAEPRSLCFVTEFTSWVNLPSFAKGNWQIVTVYGIVTVWSCCMINNTLSTLLTLRVSVNQFYLFIAFKTIFCDNVWRHFTLIITRW